MNPILTLLNFSTYSCKDKTTNENYIFIIRNSELIENTTINFQNTNSKIIRLNKVEEVI